MIRFAALPLALAVTAAPLLAQATLSPTDQSAAFHAAGFKRVGQQWQACGDPGTLSYSPGAIESVADLNGDGRPEAIVTEGGPIASATPVRATPSSASRQTERGSAWPRARAWSAC